MWKRFVSVCCWMILAGCGTPYKPYSYFGGGGYRDVQLAENVFKITVEANGYTTSARAADLALLRAADLTLQHGVEYFIIGALADHSYSTSYTTPETTSIHLATNGRTANAAAITSGGQTYSFHFPAPSITITTFKEKPEVQGTVYQARMVSASLRRELGITE